MVDIVQKYFYGGIEYDSYEAAANAEATDIRAATEAFYPTPLVEKYDRIFPKYMQRKQFPLYLKVTDKYSTSIVLLNSIEDVQTQSLALLSYRVKDGYWYNDEAAKLAKAIVDANNGAAAYMFLSERTDCEYEEFELNRFDKF